MYIDIDDQMYIVPVLCLNIHHTHTTEPSYYCLQLLINLWNAPNALSGQSSLHAFLNTGCCLLAAASMQECLACYHKAQLGTH